MANKRTFTPLAIENPSPPSWLSELEKWEQAPYDGIKGILPTWIQRPFSNQFYGARGTLVVLVAEHEATYEDIRARFDYMVRTKHGEVVHALMDARSVGLFSLGELRSGTKASDALHTIANIYRAVQLGEEEGLRLLAGDVAVKGYHAKVAVRKRPDFVDKPSVQQIGKEEWALNPTATFKEIINSPGLKPFVDKYSDRTLQLWLRAIDPRDQKKKRGRPTGRK